MKLKQQITDDIIISGYKMKIAVSNNTIRFNYDDGDITILDMNECNAIKLKNADSKENMVELAINGLNYGTCNLKEMMVFINAIG